MTVKITVTSQDDTAEARILNLLNAHSDAAGHSFRVEPVTLEACAGETYLGGLTAQIVQDWMFINLLAVSDAARGTGVGRHLMTKAEAIASERDLSGLWLDTFSYQAPGFYDRLGYTRIAELPDSPKGHSRYFYAKRL